MCDEEPGEKKNQQGGAYKTTCIEARMCLCCPEAQPLVKFRLQLLKHIATTFTSRGKPKATLVQGKVFVELSWSAIPSPDDQCQHGQDLSVEAGSESGDEAFSVFWHIGLTYLKPFRPTVQLTQYMDLLEDFVTVTKVQDSWGKRLALPFV